MFQFEFELQIFISKTVKLDLFIFYRNCLLVERRDFDFTIFSLDTVYLTSKYHRLLFHKFKKKYRYTFFLKEKGYAYIKRLS